MVCELHFNKALFLSQQYSMTEWNYKMKQRDE